jgi:hypothetical protein
MAEKTLIFVTPYIELWVHLKDEVRDAMARKVDILFLIREDHANHKQEELEWLIANKVKVYLIPNLHAKIYLNEKSILVSSMNMHRTSIIDSKDFAISIRNEVNGKKFRDYVNKLMTKGTIIRTSSPTKDHTSRVAGIPGRSKSARLTVSAYQQHGYCIRSAHNISYDVDKPLCSDCYRQWNKYQDADYAEQYCHSCGNEADTTFNRPLCKSCWKKSN